MKKDFTWAWKQYENGKLWNNRLDPPYYDGVTVNWEMFNGNQWINAAGLSAEFPQPVFNIIKRSIQFFISAMTSSAITGRYEAFLNKDDDYEDMDNLTAKIATNAWRNYLEEIKADMVARDLLLDAAVSGDMAIHMYFDPNCEPYGDKFQIKGKIKMETIDGNNIYLGNPNNRDIQNQPYVLIYGRDTVENIKEEIRIHQKIKDINVEPDNDNEEQASEAGKIEIDSDEYGKVGYVLCYRKKREKGKTTVWVSKSLREQVIYEVDTGLTRYPVAFNNWEHQKNNYHGRSLVTDIIPNQIFVNRMFAMAMYHLQQTAFPKAVYDSERVSGWSNQVGAAIPVELQPGESIFNVAGYLQPSTMSPQIIQLIDMTIKYTKEMIGANDALLGEINPEQASGAAISVTAQQSGIPLEGPKSNLNELFEDMMYIYADMAGNYYGERPVIVDLPEIGKQLVNFDFGKLTNMQFNVKADVGATSYYSEIAQRATLDNLLASNMIEFADYLERVPEDFVPDKSGLIAKIKEKAQMMAQQPQQMV